MSAGRVLVDPPSLRINMGGSLRQKFDSCPVLRLFCWRWFAARYCVSVCSDRSRKERGYAYGLLWCPFLRPEAERTTRYNNSHQLSITRRPEQRCLHVCDPRFKNETSLQVKSNSPLLDVDKFALTAKPFIVSGDPSS